MPELKNTFAWSFSAAEAFDACPRKRYWGVYARWGGWAPGASEIQRKAWQLSRMDTLPALRGKAVEKAIMWALREMQAGRTVTPDQAYEQIAKPWLNTCWTQSKQGLWRTDCKANCCLREHYCGQWNADQEKEAVTTEVANIRRCIGNFTTRVWPRLKDISPADEIAIGGPGEEFFMLHDVKINAIPDYAVRTADAVRIHDWKAGKPSEKHRTQLNIYGLWAKMKHGAVPENTLLFVEYLSDGKLAAWAFSEEELRETLEWIEASVAAMTGYLENEDRAGNIPLPREQWDLATEPELCRNCNFYELCKPELGF